MGRPMLKLCKLLLHKAAAFNPGVQVLDSQ
jgi:hypothetical protein